MAFFGGSRRGSGGNGLVATREDEERARQLEAMFGTHGIPADTKPLSGTPGGLLGSSTRGARSMLPAAQPANQFEPTLPDFQTGDTSRLPSRLPMQTPPTRQLDPELQAMIGNAPVKKNNTLRDILAGIAAVAGDTLAIRNGQRAFAGDNLAKRWGARRTDFQQQMQDFENRQRIAKLPGMSVREMAAYMADPKAWGSNMSRAATSRYDAATLNPGDQRFLGDGNGVYQAPTRAQQYAESLGLPEGTDQWNNAIRDQELGSQGPTAFGNQQTIQSLRDAQAARMERMRQQGRLQMEGTRQGNRVTTRQTPTYRDMNPPPGRGQRLSDIPTVRTPAEAQALPPGTRFKTPDGRVKVR